MVGNRGVWNLTGWVTAAVLMACPITPSAQAKGTAGPTTGGAQAASSCFSQAAADQRIAACSALIHAGAPSARNAAKHASKRTSGKSARTRATKPPATGAPLPADVQTAQALLNRADAFGQRGDYRHAIDDVTRVIHQSPSAVAYYTRALAYHNLGKETRAIADSNAALKLEPHNANALFVRASAHEGLGDYPSAIRDFDHVLRLDPNRVDALFSRGAAHYSAGEYQRAVEDFSRTIEHGAAEGTVYYLRGLAYQGLGQTAQARADMEEALRRDPNLEEKPPVPGSHMSVREL